MKSGSARMAWEDPAVSGRTRKSSSGCPAYTTIQLKMIPKLEWKQKRRSSKFELIYLLTMIPAPVIMPMRKLGTREATTIMRLSITEMQRNILRLK